MKRYVPDFDSVARLYAWAEYATLGPLLMHARTYFLPELQKCRNAMVLGDGDGRFLARWMAQDPALRAVAVDSSAKMLELLRRNCIRAAPDASQRLTMLQASALDAVPAAENDAIVSHFFLDCLQQDEVETLVSHFAEILKPGTLWVVSDFALPRLQWMRPLAAVYIRMLYFAFRVLTGLRVTQLPDVSAAFCGAGFARVMRKQWLGGLVYAEIWSLE